MKVSDWDFRTSEERDIQEKYLRQGYVIYRDTNDNNGILNEFESIYTEVLGNETKVEEYMHELHKSKSSSEVNNIRVALMDRMNINNIIIKQIYDHCKVYIHTLCGNELAVQKRVSMSLMFPHNNKDVLPLHADTWNGVSPFELAVFIPLIDLSEDMTLYMATDKKLSQKIKSGVENGIASDVLYEKNKDAFERIKLYKGDVLFFDHSIPHGLAVNTGKHVHWALNIRFKAIMSPYAEKKLGEYFMPVTLKPCTIIGMENMES